MPKPEQHYINSTLNQHPQLQDVHLLREVFRPGVTLREAAIRLGVRQPELSYALKHHGFVRQWVPDPRGIADAVRTAGEPAS